MKNLFKNIFSKVSFFGKKSYKTTTNFVKKHPKASLIFLVLVFMMPTISFADWSLGSAVYWGFLKVVGALIALLKYLAAKIMFATGYIFDNMIYVTISKGFYDLNWVKISWGTMRDVANIAFIGGIIIIGFFMMTGRTQWKKMFFNLVIVAFVMNFSMFIGRVIIDAGNFTSAIFYSMSSVKLTGGDSGDRFSVANALLGTDGKPYFGPRSIATGLAAFVDPNSLYTNEEFEELIKSTVKIKTKESQSMDNTILETKIILDIVFIITSILFSKVLLQGAFMMISRTIYIIKYLVLSPLYFARYFLPGGAGALYEWFGDIAGKAFCLTGYMIGMWMIFLFLSAKSLMDSFGNITAGVSGTTTLIAIVSIKVVIVYKAVDWLNEFGTKECEDGHALGAGIADKAMGLAKFAGGGAVLAGAKMFGVTAARGALAKTGHYIGKKTKDLDKSKWAAGRYAGRLGLRAEHWSWNKKIGGSSFNDEVTRTSKENAEIDARHTEDERKEIFYQRHGGDKIKYKEGTEFKGKKQKEIEKNLKEEMKKLEEEQKKYMGKTGLAKYTGGEQVAKQRKKVEELKQQLSNAELSGKEKIEKAWEQAHNIAGVKRGKVGSVMNLLGKAAYIGTGTNLALADVDEANRQYKEKRSIITEFKENKDKQKELIKEATKEYNDERSKINLEKDKNKSEIELAKKELASSKNIEGLISKQVKMWDVNRDGVLDLKQIEKAKNDPEKMIELMKKTNFGEHLDGIDGAAYAISLKALNKQQENLKNMESELRGLISSGAKQEDIDAKQAEIKSQKKNVEAMANDKTITDVVKAFEKIANQKVSHINDAADTEHTKSKESYEKKKKDADNAIKKLNTQEKESKEDLALGRNRRYNSKDNIVSSVGDAEPQT